MNKTTIYEPPHDKTNKMTCAPSEDSDPSLCAQWVAEDPMFQPADSADSEQTGRIGSFLCLI